MSKSRCIGYAGGDVRTGFAGGLEGLVTGNGRREVSGPTAPIEPAWKTLARQAETTARMEALRIALDARRALRS